MSSLAATKLLSRAARRAVPCRKEFSTLLALEEEYPGLPSTTPEPAKASTTSVTTLSSGLIVATEDAASTTTVSMTYPKAGSGSEMLGEHGAALINKCLAFNSGSGLSTIVINRSIENEGGTPFATADRTGATLGFTVEADSALALIPLLATDCTFEKWDVRDAVKLASYQVAEANKSAQVVLTEQLYAAAYGPQSPMGRPFYCADASMDEIVAFRGRAYGLNGAVLAATGVKDHQAFCTAVEELLSESPAGTSDAAPAASYLGGEARIAAPSAHYAHVALAFETKAPVAVRNVVKKCFDVIGAEAGVTSFATKDLIGVYAGAPSEGVGSLDTAITNTVTSAISADVLASAKTLAKAEALFTMDGGSKGMAEIITSHVLEGATFTNGTAVAAAYDAVSQKDVTDAIAAMMKTNPSVAAVGDIGVVPYQGTFASRLK